MTYPRAIALAAYELAHVLRFPALLLVLWLVGFAVLGPLATWGWP